MERTLRGVPGNAAVSATGEGLGPEEHWTAILEGGASWNAWRRQRPGLTPDLSGRRLGQERTTLDEPFDYWLTEVDLQGARLVGSNLVDGCFRNSRFDGADMTNAVLRRADLGGASLRGAVLVGADFRNASLGG